MVNILRITIVDIIGEEEVFFTFVPFINETPKKTEKIQVTRNWYDITQTQLKNIYRLYSNIGEKMQKLKSASIEEISKQYINIIKRIPGDTTLEKLKAIGSRIYRKLFPEQFKIFLKDEEISIITFHATEFNIPFELMFDDPTDSFLATKYTFYRIPLVDNVKAIPVPEAITKKKQKFAIFTNPTMDLIATQEESDKILKSLEQFDIECENYVHSDIDLELIMNTLDLKRLDVFHYTGHSRKTEDNIYFKLMDKDFSIKDVSLRYPTFFFLNMCESDLKISSEKRNIYLHFPTELIQQGARACVATLWPIIQTSSAKFAVQFYEQLLDGKHIGDAICKTKADLIDQIDPFDITPMSFIVYGTPEGSYVEITKDKKPKLVEIDEFEKEKLIDQKISKISFLYSGPPGHSSPDQYLEGRMRGVLTFALIKGLTEISYPITFGQLVKYTNIEVKKINNKQNVYCHSSSEGLDKILVGDNKIGNKWAFIVGISKYLNVRNLVTPDMDALELADNLYNTGEFEEHNIITLLSNDKYKHYRPTLRNIKSQFLVLLTMIQPSDTLIIYYSGRAFMFSEQDFILPRDYKEDKTTIGKKWLSLNWFVNKINKYQPQLEKVYILLDTDRTYHSATAMRY